MRTARGSLQEIETQLLISQRIGLTRESQVRPILDLAAEVSRLISGLLRALDPGP